ncbi:hypothetical protein HK099_004819 [Clydaea vesicula]|uniref:Uncharacterized protein n=1 Tax=Clydaea vesicula TaxID=447962 RepID=A0AAD5TZR9_9FUNG|nr:hypothetical protein HK099_004819 [Clydaea vesicula]
MSNGVKFFNVGILINMIETEIKIDIDLGYPKPIHNIFGDNLAKKINDIVYNNKLYVFVHDTSTENKDKTKPEYFERERTDSFDINLSNDLNIGKLNVNKEDRYRSSVILDINEYRGNRYYPGVATTTYS